MATYLPGGTDTGFNPVQYSPNLSLLANSIDRATARYETNFAKVSKGYNNILSASILNDGYSQKRDQYLSEIKDKLKTIFRKDRVCFCKIDWRKIPPESAYLIT